MRAVIDSIKRLIYPYGQHKVWINREASTALKSYEQKVQDEEAGGILLGNVYEDYDEIMRITVPNVLDKKGPRSFMRNRNAAQGAVDNAWIESSGSLVYLGEWHTHFENNPKPSRRDREMIATVFAETIMDLRHLYLIIIGRKGNWWAGQQTHQGLREVRINIRG